MMIDLLRTRILPLAAMFLLGAVAGAGLLPLLPLGNDEPPTFEPSPSSTTTTLAPETLMVEVGDAALPELPGVHAAISRVLVESGFASQMTRGELQAEVDPSIIEVLEQSDAVVTVVEDQAGETVTP